MASGSSNLPLPGQVFLDHVGHFVPDPEACAAALRAAGFAVTPFSAQVAPDPETGRPGLTGTGNVCVMLRSGYLEFLAHTADTPIGLEFKEALARRAGLHLAAFAVADAAEAHGRLSAAGLAMRPLVRMARTVETGSGPVEARFTVARLRKGVMPEGRVQLLTHGDAAALWQERWLDHPNGATGLGSVVISAPDPSEAAARFSAVLGRPASQSGAEAMRIELDRGAVEILREDAAARLIGAPVAPGRPAIVGYELEVVDVARTAENFRRAGIQPHSDANRAVLPFPPELGLGAWIVIGQGG